MRQVKCRDTGELVPISDAWKAPDGKYYSSEGAFERLVHDKQCRQECLTELGNILGYFEGQKFPTIVAKKLKEYEGYGYDVVLRTIRNKKEAILYSINNKDFSSEYCRVAYVMAIITNNINDVRNAINKEKKAQVASSPIITSDEIEDSISPTVNSGVRDISKFL